MLRSYLLFSFIYFVLCPQHIYSCPEPPENDDPCYLSTNPPTVITGDGQTTGTTCCARGPQDLNPDGSAADFQNIECIEKNAALWYTYIPNSDAQGFLFQVENIAILTFGLPRGVYLLKIKSRDNDQVVKKLVKY